MKLNCVNILLKHLNIFCYELRCKTIFTSFNVIGHQTADHSTIKLSKHSYRFVKSCPVKCSIAADTSLTMRQSAAGLTTSYLGKVVEYFINLNCQNTYTSDAEECCRVLM